MVLPIACAAANKSDEQGSCSCSADLYPSSRSQHAYTLAQHGKPDQLLPPHNNSKHMQALHHRRHFPVQHQTNTSRLPAKQQWHHCTKHADTDCMQRVLLQHHNSLSPQGLQTTCTQQPRLPAAGSSKHKMHCCTARTAASIVLCWAAAVKQAPVLAGIQAAIVPRQAHLPNFRSGDHTGNTLLLKAAWYTCNTLLPAHKWCCAATI